MKRLHHVGLVVDNLDETIMFYEGSLGFTVLEQWINPHNGAKVALVAQDELTYEMIEYVTNPFEGQSAYNHVAIVVEDLDETVAGLIERGVKMIDDAPRIVMGGRGRIMFCSGPNGEMIELHQQIDQTNAGRDHG